MTTVPPSPTDGRSSLSSNPVRPPIAQRYFIGSPDESIKDSLSRAYTSDYPSPVTSSAVSSNPPSPNLPPSAYQHLPPTPTGSVSFSEPDDQDDELLLPSYDSLYTREELDTPSEHTLDSPLFSHCLTPRIPAADDSSVKEEPSRHVDYLSHEWKEEDIWASWRHVITRREVYENSVRLENASWRTWAKLKRNLGTISPEALNWLKDCDVTWLYGPLIASRTRNRASNISPPPSCSESPGLCPDRKSILKKRTASEAILQRSLSQHTLLQHAGDILKAQEAEYSRSHLGFGMHPAEFEQMASKTHLEGFKTPRARFTATTSPSGVGSPSERRHIHFNKEVLQCIAVEAKEEEEEEWLEFGGDESWDESVMVKSASPSGSSTPRASLGNENKTIAPLPSTTLKYRSDTPEPQLSSVASRWSWTRYLPRPGSSLIETLRQTRWQSSVAGLEGDSMASDHDWNVPQEVDQSSRSWFVDSTEDDEATQNFYLTSLGFLSHEDGPPSNADVIFDRMMDTVNTAKDIAHVIWNVGWRG